MRGGSWSAERIDLLKRLWSEGQSAGAIGERLGGMSRSAVLGKVFRLRLHANSPGSLAPAKRQAADIRGEDAATLNRRRRSPLRKQQAQPPPIRRTQHKSLLELTNNTCRWPHGRPGTDRFFFCGAPEADLEHGIPYCARHMRRAYGTTASDEPVSALDSISHSLR